MGVAILKTNFRFQYYRTCVTTSVWHLFRSTRYGTVESVSCTGTCVPSVQTGGHFLSPRPTPFHILLFLITGSTILIDFLLLRFLSFFFFERNFLRLISYFLKNLRLNFLQRRFLWVSRYCTRPTPNKTVTTKSSYRRNRTYIWNFPTVLILLMRVSINSYGTKYY